MSYSYDTTGSANAASALFAFSTAYIIFYFAIIFLIILGMWKVYEKGNKPGWACLIPIYNLVVLLEMIDLPTIYILYSLIPLSLLHTCQ